MNDYIIYIIIGINVLASYYGWKNPAFFERFTLNPYQIVKNKEYERVITHAFLHGSRLHLFINMIVLWSFGQGLIVFIEAFFDISHVMLFLALYFGAIVVSSLYSISKHKNNINYNAVGASGATSAVVFACIFFAPWHMLYLFAIIPVPGIVFGVFYLIYSYKMAKKAADNIGHDAHFWGAVFGFLFFMVIKPELLQIFMNQLTNF